MRFKLAMPAVAAALVLAPTPSVAAGADSPGKPRLPLAGFPLLEAGPNILGTIAQPIRADRFTSSAQHAFADASGSVLMQRLIAPARRLNRFQQMSYIQSRVTTNIRWVSDATEWGKHDYWASASETLAHGAGDMEDRAIVKMQALKNLGFNPSDLFLTLARDRVGGPIAVLMARLNGRYFVLDDTGGAPFPVDQRKFEFQPVMSFGWAGTWVHTRGMPARVTAAAARTIAGK
jgi:predicted transglutaminase-like cysteine proteinase